MGVVEIGQGGTIVPYVTAQISLLTMARQIDSSMSRAWQKPDTVSPKRIGGVAAEPGALNREP